MEDISNEIKRIESILFDAYNKSKLTEEIGNLVHLQKISCDDEIREFNGENATKKEQSEKMLTYVNDFVACHNKFNDDISRLSTLNYRIESKTIVRGNNELSITNRLEITEDKIINAINKYLKSKVDTRLSLLQPESLYDNNWSRRSPKVNNYNDLADKIYTEISSANEVTYNIKNKRKGDFINLSPGWKTAILLDLILNSTDDYAPLVIDQPEDNLASNYLNKDLVDLIHQAKQRRQIIIVTHNATIPMLGDAQNIIICQNTDGFITVKSYPLEGSIQGKDIVDYVADLTDGGKSSIKKRFKKYNLKNFKGEE